jgi:hypothetical protein
MDNSTSTGRILMKFDIRAFFDNLSRKFQFQWHLTRVTGTLHEDRCTFMRRLLIIFAMKYISDESCRENENTHFMFHNFYKKSCRLWDNIEQWGGAWEATDDNIVLRMRFAYWITKTTHTHIRCNTYYFSTATVVTRTLFSVTLYVHCLSCYLVNNA